MKYTVIAIIASAVAFGVQAYADYTTDAAKQAMREAEEATRLRAGEIEKLYQSLPPLEKVRGDAEATK